MLKIKTLKRYQPTRLEVAKTVLIAVLVTGVISFIAGNLYADSKHNQLTQAVSAQAQPKK